MSECLRLNRPCILRGLAHDWPAIEKWKSAKNGVQHLESLFEEDKLGIFTKQVN